MPSFHLWFEKPSELAFDRPPDPIPLLMSALYYVLAVREYVRIRPYALVDNQFRNRLRLLVLLRLSALDGAPESLGTAVCVLAEGTGAHRQTRRVLHSLQLLLTCSWWLVVSLT
jgi:hypothetical protein